MRDREPRRIEIETVPSSLQLAAAVEDIETFDIGLIVRPNMLHEIFTPGEIAYCGERVNSLASRLAAKSAMRSLLEREVPWQTVEITSSPSKKPLLFVHDDARIHADAKGFRSLAVSLTHDEGVAAAMVAAATSETTLHLGIDVTSTDRIAGVIQRRPNFLKHVYTPEELDQAHGDDAEMLASSWAAKEAVTKALGTGQWREGIDWKHVELLRQNELYEVRLSEAALRKSDELGIHTWHVSVQRYENKPIAYVIGVSE